MATTKDDKSTTDKPKGESKEQWNDRSKVEGMSPHSRKDPTADYEPIRPPGVEGPLGPEGPAGDGGITPKSTPDHQYQFPPNPEPSESAQAKAKEDEERDKKLHG
jgi:hypothetical protein